MESRPDNAGHGPEDPEITPVEFAVDADGRITETLVPGYRFWKRLGSDPYQGIEKLARLCKINDKNLVLAAAIFGGFGKNGRRKIGINAAANEAALQQVGKNLPGWLEYLLTAKHWIIFGLVMLSITGGIAFRVYTALDNEIIVRKPGGIKMYSRIEQGDVHNNAPGKAVEGLRYVLSNVPQNDFLVEKDLLSEELSNEMSGRAIVSIPVKNDVLNSRIKPNSKISITFTYGQNPAEQPTTVSELIVLGVEKRADSSTLTVGMRRDQLNILDRVPSRTVAFVSTTP